MTENLPDTNVGNIEYTRKADAVDALKAQADTMRKWASRYDEQRRGVLTAVNIVEDIKPADVVQVVRCKDCEWAVKSTELPGWYMCKCEEAFDYYAKPDDFCSHGKRREE